jgi:hypothetical protein
MAKYAKDQPAGFNNLLSKVAIVGAGGQIGGYFTEALLKTGKHTVTAITRPDSASKLPEGVVPAYVDYDDHASIVAALKGHDIFIITMSRYAPRDSQSKLFKAAADAGVPYVMPNAYGPDPACEGFQRDMFLFAGQAADVKAAQALGLKTLVLSMGYWFEFSLGGGEQRYGFDFRKRSVVFFDEGAARLSTTTFPQCGRALAALLSLPRLPRDEADEGPTIARYEDGVCYVESFTVSQRDMFEAAKRVTGTTDADWAISREDARERTAKAGELVAKGDFREAFARWIYTRVLDDRAEGDVSAKSSNEVLGLPKEDFDEWVKIAVEQAEAGKYDDY